MSEKLATEGSARNSIAFNPHLVHVQREGRAGGRKATLAGEPIEAPAPAEGFANITQPFDGVEAQPEEDEAELTSVPPHARRSGLARHTMRDCGRQAAGRSSGAHPPHSAIDAPRAQPYQAAPRGGAKQ